MTDSGSGRTIVDKTRLPDAFPTHLFSAAFWEQLGPLIDSFGKAVREHPEATLANPDDLLAALREASKVRNALCRGSW